ncbi:IclR family transcriptional regulator [Streptomyces jeddahensis]|uniref:HTH-type transcriptional regulator KipR n=1 Tax=Streptomyces jeddahensis TaxID=1716141 RepID=A0A177HTF1_9ACTN|nr:IclR family transcriptional regulator [Streptomyces jeddahensis]OAH13950.1 HTH-type transcriptional regulator KipR [Streptomyces jeddahensis]
MPPAVIAEARGSTGDAAAPGRRRVGAVVPDNGVARVSAVLDCFGVRTEHLSVSELSRRSGLPKSTTSRLVADMVGHGLLERDGAALRLGCRIFEWGQHVPRRRALRDVALPLMSDLRAATRLSVHLAVLDGADVVYVEVVRGDQVPHMPSQVGGRIPAHATAVGKAMLAFAPRRTFDEVVASGLPRVGPRTLTTPRALARELERIRRDGLACEQEESGPGIACVAGPILDRDRKPVAALSVSGWSGRLQPNRVAPAVRTAVLTAGRMLSSTD